MSLFAHLFEPYGTGQKAGIGSLINNTLKAKMIAYKRNVAKRYRIVTPDRIADLIPPGNLHISTKVDGELWYLCKQGGEVAFCSPTGRVVIGIPAAQEAERQLEKVGDIVIAGELFAVVKGGRSRVKDVARAMSDGSLAPTLGFKAFDILAEGDEDTQKKPYGERYARLQQLFAEGRRVAVVATVEGQADAVHGKFDEWVASGNFEGLVVRADQGIIYKVKPTIDVDVVVLGFGEHRSADGAEVRELIIGLVRSDGQFHVLGTVGSGLSQADRLAWLTKLEPLVVPSAFRMANSEGTLCRWVKPQIIVQLRISDLLDSDTRDAAIRRMVLSYGDDGYTPTGVADFVSLLAPVFVRERPDKPVDPGYVGVEQVMAFVPMEVAELEAPTTQPKSVVLARRVWTKGGKGGTAVRKMVLLQTNKGGPGSDWPAFVAHFTDFSSGRKDPLDTKLRVASTQAGIVAIGDAWVTENVKKGWEEVT